MLARNWGLVLLRGIAAVSFGVAAIAWPGLTLIALTWLFGIFAIADGIFALVAAFSGRAKGIVPTWWLVLVGIIGILAGIATLVYPGLTALMLATFIGVWALMRGVFEIIGAIQLRKVIDNEWWLILNGALCVLFGLFLLVSPGAGALAMVWVIGIYALLVGVVLIALAFRLKKHASHASVSP
jgi:uncharacterized membrane protein HdeD (DUF308 family)